MLTSTYTLVALSVEQARARTALQTLLDRWRPAAWWGEPPAAHQYEAACEALRQASEACQWRKLDKFVLPALRRRGVDAVTLLAELDALSRRAHAACWRPNPPRPTAIPAVWQRWKHAANCCSSAWTAKSANCCRWRAR